MQMTEQAGANLEELQRIDQEIEHAEKKIRSSESLLEEVGEGVAEIESEVETTRSRLQEMRVEERRVELSTQEKRNRVKKLEDRLNTVRNVREEAAVSAEADMVRRALEGEEQEALTLLEQIRKLEMRLEEQETSLAEARADVEPRRQEILNERKALEEALEGLRSERERFTGAMEANELRVYERIRGRDGRRAVARLTPDGACGHCFNMIPLQLRNEIRHGSDMIRCEACGVILAAAEVDPEG
jgi:predicted  nucleic acid-binding Zn-ribbon protein